MKDREFSPPGEEFSAPGPEFSPVGGEFSARGREYSAPGPEFYEESAAPVQRREKKRRTGPLMLAAAAVVTAAVVIAAPAVQENVEPKPEYPLCEITEDHRDYLDTVWAAVDSGDVEAMTNLTRDPRLRELVVDYIAPYANEMKETHGQDVVRYLRASDGVGDGNYAADYYYDYYVYYDGENLGTWEALDEPWETQILWLYYCVNEFGFEVEFELSQRGAWTVGDQYPEKIFKCTQYTQGGLTDILWYDWVREYVEYRNGVMSAAVECTFCEKRVWETEQRMTELWASGENVVVLEGEQPLLREYLENGTLTYAYQEDGRSGAVEMEVRDGWLILDDGLTVEPLGDVGYQLVFEDGHTLTSQTMDYLSDGGAEEYLYHLYRVCNFVGDGI